MALLVVAHGTAQGMHSVTHRIYVYLSKLSGFVPGGDSLSKGESCFPSPQMQCLWDGQL